MRQVIRRKHYSIRTEKTYIDWIERFIFFHKVKHPQDMGADEIEAFLNHLATDKKLAASTQNQGMKFRRTMLPKRLIPLLRNHLEQIKLIHENVQFFHDSHRWAMDEIFGIG